MANKKYFTVDSNDLCFFFVRKNKNYYIRIKGKKVKHLYKKSFFAVDYHYSFTATDCEFEFLFPEQFHESGIELGDILFIRSNLVYKCCG